MITQQVIEQIKGIIAGYPLIAEVKQVTALDWINKTSEPLLPCALITSFDRSYSSGAMTMNVNIFLLDMCGRDTQYHDIIASDLTDAAVDIFSRIKYIFAVENSLEIKVVNNEYENCLSGVSFSVDVVIPYSLDRC